jgi:hypothetical protein
MFRSMIYRRKTTSDKPRTFIRDVTFDRPPEQPTVTELTNRMIHPPDDPRRPNTTF